MESRSVLGELFQARVRTALVEWVVQEGGQATVSELARMAKVTPRAARVEVAHLQSLGLVRVESKGAAVVVSRRRESPLWAPLRALSKAVVDLETPETDANTEKTVRETLAFYGAPLVGTQHAKRMGLERALVMGLALARRDSTLLRTLPLVVAKQADSMDWVQLKKEARRSRMKLEVGMLVSLAARLVGRPDWAANVEDLRDARRKGTRFFQPPRGEFERRLARQNTPRVVRAWGFLMNMGEDSFRSLIEKHLATV